MHQSAFAALSLHEKNEYLQTLTSDYLKARGRAHAPLSKQALSRLRRFYMRRSLTDLRLDATDDTELRQVLERLSRAIRKGDIGLAIESEIPPSASASILRDPPDHDAQMMFFVPSIHDAPLKDEVNLMDIAPFSLSKNKRFGTIRYELNDSVITIEGGAEAGLATAFDYDIFLNMVSYLAEEMRQFRQLANKGRRPDLPGRVYRPSAAQILKFCRRSNGGRQYLELEKALDRLQATRIKITNMTAGKRRQTESFSLLSRYKVVSRTSQNRIDQVEIEIEL